jgi:hypothetical protein
MKEIFPLLALVAVFVLTWGGAWWKRRRFRAAVAELVTKLEGRFEPGSHTSGGTLFGRLDGRDIVVVFYRGSTSRGPSTTALATLARPLETKLLLKRREALERAPELKPFASLFAFGIEIRAESNLLAVEVPGVLRDARRILALASIALTQAKNAEA